VVVVDQEPFNGEDMSPAPVPEPEAMTADVGGGDEEGQQNGFTEDGLAVAMAVDAGEEDDYVYAAIEYDPDAKPPLHRNRRFRVYTCLAIVLVAAAVAVTVIYVTKGAKGVDEQFTDINVATLPTMEPTPSPLTNREQSGIIEQIEAGVLQRGAVFANMTVDDPRKMALEWILHYDQMQLNSDDVNLYQRYVLALLAFSLDSLAWYYCGNHRMVNANETVDFVQEDCDVLASTGVLESHKVWLSSADECEWYGAKCSSTDGVLRGLEMSKYICFEQLVDFFVPSPSSLITQFSSSLQWVTTLLENSPLKFLNCVSSNTLPLTVTVSTEISPPKWAPCPTSSLSSFRVTDCRGRFQKNLITPTNFNCSMVRCSTNTLISVPHPMEGL